MKREKTIKWLIIGGAILVLVVLAIILALVSNRQKAAIPTPEQIASDQMLWPSFDASFSTVYYFSNASRPAFFKMSLADKKATQISDDLDTPDTVKFSPDFSAALMTVTYRKYIFEKYGSVFKDSTVQDGALTHWVYNFSTKKLTRIHSPVNSALWNSDNQIIYQTQDSTSALIFRANASGLGATSITKIDNLYIDKLIGIQSNDLYYVGEPGEAVTNLYKLNLDSKQATTVAEDISDDCLLSQTKALLQIIQKGVTTLGWIDLASPKIQDSKVRSTITDSAWLTDLSFVSYVTTNNKAQFSIFDTTTQKTKTFVFNEPLTALVENITPSPDQKSIYFTADNLLYKLAIPN